MQRPSIDSLVESLRSLPVFKELAADTLRTLALAAAWRAYAPGALVFLEGEPAAGFYYLHTGWLKVVKVSLQGREQTLQFAGPGEVLNYVGVFSGRSNPATAIALEEAGVWLVRRETLHQVLIAHPQVALRVLEAMADRLTELVALVSDLSLRTVEARLARTLLQSAEGDLVTRRQWATQSEMAARLGTVPDVVNRALRALALEQLIEVERNQIRILNRSGLAARAMIET